jgi:serine/threonine-protein kinase
VDGTPFGRYRLIDLLGRGGMGEVWRAYDPTLDRVVALKVLPQHFAADQVFQERFRREARAASGLDDPHVVPFYDFGEVNGLLYVTMRLINGRDLQALLADGPLKPSRAVAIIEQIASALRAAHEIGLVHRDVKPSNILVAKDDFAYLIDFGIARVTGEAGLTSTGATVGTWAYMSPERINTGRADARADIYALACVLYEALTGRRTFPGDSLEQQIVGHLTTPPPRPSVMQVGVPDAMDDVIATGMAKDPDQRYATTVELARAARDALAVPLSGPGPTVPVLTNFLGVTRPAAPVHIGDTRLAAAASTVAGPPVLPPADNDVLQPPARRTRRTPLILLASAVVAVLATAGGVFYLTDRTNQTETQVTGQTGPAVTGQTGPAVTVPARTQGMTVAATGLKEPKGVAVAANGDIYIAETGNNQVLKLAAGATSPTPLPFTGLSEPEAVAVTANGDVYVADSGNHRVLTLPSGSTRQSELPFPGLQRPKGVAVAPTGDVYITDSNGRVLKLLGDWGQVDGRVPTELLTGLQYPVGVAVSATDDVYVTDPTNGQVVKLAAGSTSRTTLPFSGLEGPLGVALTTSGDVYITDNGVKGRVLKLAAGSASQTELPFAGLSFPYGVAVTATGDVYVTDNTSNGRVLKLSTK